jgi:hypothetical protein
VLDCCYAGAAASQIDSIAKHHCLMACTTPTTRAYFEESSEGRSAFSPVPS